MLHIPIQHRTLVYIIIIAFVVLMVWHFNLRVRSPITGG